MKKAELEKYEKLLLKKREELLEQLQSRKKLIDKTIKDSTGDISSYSYHMADQGTDAMEREKAFMFASKSGRLLYHSMKPCADFARANTVYATPAVSQLAKPGWKLSLMPAFV